MDLGWLTSRLRCPVDLGTLDVGDTALLCGGGHRYPIVDGIPVLLVAGQPETHPAIGETLAAVRSEHVAARSDDGTVDPFVQGEIVRTHGNLYRSLRGRLTRYPIPELRMESGAGRSFLDVGCNWGRWSVAAARAGYHVVGIDPSLRAIAAARRVSRALGVDATFLVADARWLPFAEGTFDVAFAYSVLQHFEKAVARQALCEMSRVTVDDGRVRVQMPNVLGVRQASNFIRQRLRRDRNPFRIRSWRRGELAETFTSLIGPARIAVDGFFSLNAQISDVDLLDPTARLVVRSSEGLRRLSERVPALSAIADSLDVDARNTRAYRHRPGNQNR